MTRKRAFTMIELMLTVSLTALIVGSLTAVYAFTIERLGYGMIQASSQSEAEYGLDVIDGIVSKAQACSTVTVSGIPCLKCIMPATCADTNGDGILDTCSPNAINRRSQERWGNGHRVWFYLAGNTGVPATQGSFLWMAMRSDDLPPTATDIVRSFTYLPGNTKARLDLIESMTASPGESSNDYYVNVETGSYGPTGSNGNSNGVGLSGVYQLLLTRKPYMHGWRL
ncbi:MAG: PilW family protein [Fimbriimonadaceae bacterium]